MDRSIKILATICARAGSKGVPGKNIRPLLGKPLIAHTIEQAISSELFRHVVVSTDSEEIASIAEKFGAEVPFLRPKELADDHCAKWPAVRHALQECEKLYQCRFDIVVDLDPTSPLRTVLDIRKCVELLIKENASNVITAMAARRSPYFNLIEKFPDGHIDLSKKTNPPITCRQDSPRCYDMNASVYVWRRDVLVQNESIFLDGTVLYEMPMERSIDIDCDVDFQIVEFFAARRDMQ